MYMYNFYHPEYRDFLTFYLKQLLYFLEGMQPTGHPVAARGEDKKEGTVFCVSRLCVP
jgi:hypothetical protein